MGVKISDILPAHDIDIKELEGRIIVLDGNLVLYQFLSSIRGPDGTPLTDSHGVVTSHLQGLFGRATNLMQKGVKLAVVFDGKPPQLKLRERARRREAKEAAQKKYEAAAAEQNIEAMRTYAAQTTRLTPDMIQQAMRLLSLLGIPVVQAPSEGEAQAARIVRDGDGFAVGTQDADAFLFGSPRIIKNLTLSERRKAPGRLAYSAIAPQRIELAEILRTLSITHEQLISLSMLVGTDYNPGGIKGIGAKKALKLVTAHPESSALFEAVEWSKHSDVAWEDIMRTIKEIPTASDYTLDWKKPDIEGTISLLCDGHDFSRERVEATLKKLQIGASPQRGLGSWV